MSRPRSAPGYEGQFLDSGGQLFSAQHIEAAIIDRPWLQLALANAVIPRTNSWRPRPAKEVDPDALAGDGIGYSIGIDFGQARDHTAIVVVEQRAEIGEELVPGSPHPFNP